MSRSFAASWGLAKKRSKPEEPRGREAVFHPESREDLRYWVETDRKLALRVLDLVDAVLREPFVGIGKPEPLRYLGSDVWSRRIPQELRLVYLVSSDLIDVLQARYHYWNRPTGSG